MRCIFLLSLFLCSLVVSAQYGTRLLVEPGGDGLLVQTGSSLYVELLGNEPSGIKSVTLSIDGIGPKRERVRTERFSRYQWNDRGQDRLLQNLACGQYLLIAYITPNVGPTYQRASPIWVGEMEDLRSYVNLLDRRRQIKREINRLEAELARLDSPDSELASLEGDIDDCFPGITQISCGFGEVYSLANYIFRRDENCDLFGEQVD